MFRPDSKHLLRLRQDKGLNEREVAEQVQMDFRTLRAWEAGTVRDFHLNKFARLAAFYGYRGLAFVQLLVEDESRSHS